MLVLEGKSVAKKIEEGFTERLIALEKKRINPYIAVLGIVGDSASEIYIKRIKKNCEKYGIKIRIELADTEEEFINIFYKIKKDNNITGIMFQQPLPKKILELINEIPSEKDIEGIGINNMGKLFLDREDAIIPCTSKAVIEILDFYNIDLTGKKVVVVGRSNIVGKPLIPQLIKKNATVTVCHSKTKELSKEIKCADVVIMAIGKAGFLKKEDIKDGAICIDVGINYEDGKIIGDIDYENIKDKARACTPVPGGVGVVTNALLINNIIKSCEI